MTAGNTASNERVTLGTVASELLAVAAEADGLHAALWFHRLRINLSRCGTHAVPGVDDGRLEAMSQRLRTLAGVPPGRAPEATARQEGGTVRT